MTSGTSPSFLHRWGIVGLGGGVLALAAVHIIRDDDHFLLDFVEVSLPLIVALVLFWVGLWASPEWPWEDRSLQLARWILLGGLGGVFACGWFFAIISLEHALPGEPFPLVLNGLSVGMGFGIVIGYYYTELRTQTRRLRQQNNRLDEFAGIVSHDLRNPLNIARGNLSLARETGSQSELDERLTVVDEALERMERLIEEVLTLARQRGDIGERVPVNVGEIARQAASTVDLRGAEVQVSADYTVDGDSERLRTLFENLFRNSVEHGYPSGQSQANGGQQAAALTIRVGELADSDGFYVEDTGTGISVEHRERIFEAGFTSIQGGTGFGLAIVRRIAEAHEWTIHVTESDEGGARFEFSE